MASVRPEVERTALAPHDGKSGEPAADADGAGTLGAGDAALIQDRRASFKHHLYQQLLVVISARRSERLGEHELRLELARLAEEIAGKTDTLGLAEQQTLVEQVLDEAVGYGPLEGVLRDHEISDILINGPWQVFVEKRGQLRATDVTFRDDAHLLEVLGRMIAGSGRRVDVASPMLDARLLDGSRLNVVLKPPALNGPLVSIRRFGVRPLAAADLLASEALMKEMLEFLAACVRGRLNLILSGGTGSGKTTLLNALSSYIPESERIVTIEDTAELELQQRHVAKMEAQPGNAQGEGVVTMRDLVRNALRMRPDRIIVGECRGAEALDMLQAMNTGHEGSLTTIHGNSPRDAIRRIELMVGLAGIDIPPWAVRKLVASSIHLIVQLARMPGGRRKVVAVSEVTGMEGEVLTMHELFEFVQTGVDNNGVAQGHFRATGLRPSCLPKLNARGAGVPVQLFAERVLRR